MPYYTTSHTAYPATEPVDTPTSRDRYGIAPPPESLPDAGSAVIDALLDEIINDVLYRMLQPHETKMAMAFPRGYIDVATSNAEKTKGYDNAVTPPVSEITTPALAAALTGELLDTAT